MKRTRRRWAAVCVMVGSVCLGWHPRAVLAAASDFFDVPDATFVVSRIGACAGEPNYARENDLNQDGCVTATDVDALGVTLVAIQPLNRLNIPDTPDMPDMPDMNDTDSVPSPAYWIATVRTDISGARLIVALWTSPPSAR